MAYFEAVGYYGRMVFGVYDHVPILGAVRHISEFDGSSDSGRVLVFEGKSVTLELGYLVYRYSRGKGLYMEAMIMCQFWVQCDIFRGRWILS